MRTFVYKQCTALIGSVRGQKSISPSCSSLSPPLPLSAHLPFPVSPASSLCVSLPPYSFLCPCISPYLFSLCLFFFFASPNISLSVSLPPSKLSLSLSFHSQSLSSLPFSLNISPLLTLGEADS